MKSILCVIVLCLSAVIFVAAQNGTEKSLAKPEAPKAEAVPPKIIRIPDKMFESWKAAGVRVDDARKALEDSAAFKNLRLAESQQQAVLLYVIGELGGKPSECALLTERDGKPDVRLECKSAPKP